MNTEIVHFYTQIVAIIVQNQVTLCSSTHDMSAYEMKKLEMELKAFISRNFEKPANCKNLEQIRFYVKELCAKIEELELQFNYVPEFAYTLLAQYNSRQNVLINSEFKNSYR